MTYHFQNKDNKDQQMFISFDETRSICALEPMKNTLAVGKTGSMTMGPLCEQGKNTHAVRKTHKL